MLLTNFIFSFIFLQKKLKNKIPLSLPNIYAQPITHQMVAAQTQFNQSFPHFHSTHVPQSDSVPKSVIASKTKAVSIQIKSVEVDTSQLPQQTATETKDMPSYTEVQTITPVSMSNAISTATTSSIVKEIIVNPFVTTAVMPSVSGDTSSVVTTTTSVVPIITSSTSTVSVTPIATSPAMQESTLMDTSSVQENDLSDIPYMEVTKDVDAVSHMQVNSSDNMTPVEKENVAPVIVCSEASATPTSHTEMILENVSIDDSHIICAVSEPDESKDTVLNSSQPAHSEPTPEKFLPQPLSPVKEKHRQRAIVKPQVLTHVIDGFVIQEGPEPFPVSKFWF